MRRAAQGVRLINLKGSASIAAVARAPRSEDEEDLDEEILNEIDPNAPADDVIENTSDDITDSEE